MYLFYQIYLTIGETKTFSIYIESSSTIGRSSMKLIDILTSTLLEQTHRDTTFFLKDFAAFCILMIKNLD